MRPSAKGIHTWWHDTGIELEPGRMPIALSGKKCACWNDFTGEWDFVYYGDWAWAATRYEELPPGFKAYLLLAGIT